MSPYIVNLTNHLIGKNGYDKLQLLSRDFCKHVALDLWSGDVVEMKPAKLGEIMASFEIGDVMASKQELFELANFSGDCEDLLRTLVCACLAYTIWGRIFCSEELKLPPYRRERFLMTNCVNPGG